MLRSGMPYCLRTLLVVGPGSSPSRTLVLKSTRQAINAQATAVVTLLLTSSSGYSILAVWPDGRQATAAAARTCRVAGLAAAAAGAVTVLTSLTAFIKQLQQQLEGPTVAVTPLPTAL